MNDKAIKEAVSLGLLWSNVKLFPLLDGKVFITIDPAKHNKQKIQLKFIGIPSNDVITNEIKNWRTMIASSLAVNTWTPSSLSI